MIFMIYNKHRRQQIKRKDKVGDTVIGTHFIDLSSISSDGEKVEELKTNKLAEIKRIVMVTVIVAAIFTDI